MADEKEVIRVRAKGKVIITTDEGKTVEIENPEVLLVRRREGKEGK